MEKFISIMMQIIAMFIKGSACTIIQEKVASDKEFNKGRGTNKNPYLDGRLIIRNTFSGYVMGTDYVNSLTNAHARITGETISREEVNTKPNWHVAFPSTKNYDFGAWFEKKRSETDGCETTAYLKIQRNEQQIAHKTDTEYYLYGKLVTDKKTIDDIEQWKKGKKDEPSSTQKEVGMTKETMQHYKVIEVKTLVLIKQGEKVLNVANILRG